MRVANKHELRAERGTPLTTHTQGGVSADPLFFTGPNVARSCLQNQNTIYQRCMCIAMTLLLMKRSVGVVHVRMKSTFSCRHTSEMPFPVRINARNSPKWWGCRLELSQFGSRTAAKLKRNAHRDTSLHRHAPRLRTQCLSWHLYSPHASHSPALRAHRASRS